MVIHRLRIQPGVRFGDRGLVPCAWLLLSLVASSGCTWSRGFHHARVDGGTASGDAATDDLRARVAVSLATNVVLVEIRALETAATALESATAALALAPNDSALRTAAQTAWRDVMHVVQRLEVMQVGPLGLASTTLGGANARDEIYAWPLISRCGIDEVTANGAYADVDAFASALVDRRGLLAVEYLLFNVSTAHACGSVFDATWAGVADIAASRAAYAHTLAVLVRREATELRNAWEETGGDFVGDFATIGTSSSVYATVRAALNSFSDGLFYLDLVAKDMKVAIPAGISLTCGSASCPGSVESRFAEASVAHIRDNLLAFRMIFVGGPVGSESALGFDDILVAIGQDALRSTMLGAIDAALALVDTITMPLEWVVVNDPSKALALYDAIKAVTDLLKTQFIGVLDLERPMTAAADND